MTDAPNSEPSDAPKSDAPTKGRISEDLLAVLCAWTLLIVSFGAVLANTTTTPATEEAPATIEATNPLKAYVAKPTKWTESPIDAFGAPQEDGSTDWGPLVGCLGVFAILAVLLCIAMPLKSPDNSPAKFLPGFVVVFLLATVAYVLASQTVVKAYNLEYALWALGIGLIISNTLGTPGWVKPAVVTEFFIKTGLVLLGAEVLMSRLLALGVPGIFVAWVVTPIVLISTYAFGQKVLKMKSRTLNMVISADMSVCGVSAAIAAAAACRAKKEELSLAIGMSLSFTVVMMIVLPQVIRITGMDLDVGAAWLGGTIDATGAVAVAGATLPGERPLEIAATVKMIQNILIGVSAFGIATYWVTSVERTEGSTKPQVSEIWKRFPKFVIGFILASIVFSIIHALMDGGPEVVDAMKGSSKTMRGWFFCLAFVCIGLETRFKDLAPYFKGGKPLVLYVCGQSLNLVLTLLMAYLMFGVIFKDFIATWAK